MKFGHFCLPTYFPDIDGNVGRHHDPQLQRWLDRIRLPTLILWGENDRIFPPAYGEAWHKAIAGSRLVMLPRCGHLPIQDQPEAFAATVAEFCSTARGGHQG